MGFLIDELGQSKVKQQSWKLPQATPTQFQQPPVQKAVTPTPIQQAVKTVSDTYGQVKKAYNASPVAPIINPVANVVNNVAVKPATAALGKAGEILSIPSKFVEDKLLEGIRAYSANKVAPESQAFKTVKSYEELVNAYKQLYQAKADQGNLPAKLMASTYNKVPTAGLALGNRLVLDPLNLLGVGEVKNALKGAAKIAKLPELASGITKAIKSAPAVEKAVNFAKNTPLIYKPIEATVSPYFRNPEAGKIIEATRTAIRGKVNQLFSIVDEAQKGLKPAEQELVGKIIENTTDLTKADPKLVEIADRFKVISKEVGQQAVDLGLMKQETFDVWTKKGYMPHAVWETVTTGKVPEYAASNTIPKVSGQFFQKRKGAEDYVKSFAPNIMKGIGTEMKDVETTKMYQQIAKQFGIAPKFDSIPERDSFYYLVNNLDRLKKEYRTKYGNVINPDNAKELFREVGYNGQNSRGYHEASSLLAKEVYNDLLLENKGKGGNLLFTGGGSGVGKTTAIKETMGEIGGKYPIIIDNNFANFDSASIKVQKAIDAGFKPEIVYTIRDPIKSWTEGVVKRTARGERHVLLDIHLGLHEGAIDTAKKLSAKFGDQIDLKIIDNTGPKGTAHVVPLDYLNSLNYNKDNLRKEILNETNRLVDSGYISKEKLPEIYSGNTSGGFEQGSVAGGKTVGPKAPTDLNPASKVVGPSEHFSLLKKGYQQAESLTGVKGGYKLSNRLLPKEVSDYLTDFQKTKDRTTFDKIMDTWKKGKTLWNPGYHIRNIASNQILSEMSTGKGLVPTVANYVESVAKYLGKGEQKYVNEAVEAGIIKNKYFNEGVEKFIENSFSPQKKSLFNKIASLPGKLDNKLGELQQFSEDTAKLNVYTSWREKGATVEKAAEEAQKAIFSPYRLNPKERTIAKDIVPFYSFTRQAAPYIGKQLVTHPERFTKYPKFEQAMVNSNPPENKKYMPDYMREMIPTGAKNEKGQSKYLNLQYLYPWGSMFNEEGINTGADKGQLPLGLGLNPFFMEGAAQMFNKDPYFGTEIVKPYQPQSEQIKSRLAHVARTVLPSLYTTAGKIKSAWEGRTDYAGRQRTLGDIALEIGGIKLYPYDKVKGIERYQNQITTIEREATTGINNILRDKSLRPQERTAQVKGIIQRRNDRIKEITSQ